MVIRAVRRDVTEIARAVRRPQTLPGHARELVSLGVTAALWPLGLTDRGLRPSAGDLPAARPGTGASPVLLVHGYGANKSNWLLLAGELRAAGFNRLHAVNYNPLSADIPEIARAVGQRARELMDRHGTDRVHLVGHSTGGVVARWATQVDDLEGVASCVSVASPHEGAPLARLGVGRTAAQLRPGSRVLRELRAAARPLPTRFTAYYSNLDLIVPARSARITEPELAATNVLVRDEGHLSILLSRRLARSVATQLAAADGLAGHGRPVSTLPTGSAPEAPTPSSLAALA